MLKYNVYVGNFAGNTEHFDYGGRLGYTFGDTGVTTGLNAASGHRVFANSSDYTLYGFDLLYDKGPILWKSEIFVTDEDATVGKDRFAFYTQPAWRFHDRWIAFYRYDFLDSGAITGDTTEHAFGVTYKPNNNVHVRAIATLKHFDGGVGTTDANTQQYQLSATFSF